MQRYRWSGVALAATLVFSAASPSAAQAGPSGDHGPSAASNDPHPARASRIYMGMWTSHVRGSPARFEGNSLLGVAVRGFYGATFINSYGDRGYVGGIQRGLAGGGAQRMALSLSYRLGLVTGYDDRFVTGASRVPALPFGQIVGTVDLPGVGGELAYAGLVTSFLVSWRF